MSHPFTRRISTSVIAITMLLIVCSPFQAPTQVAAAPSTNTTHDSGDCVALSDGRGFCQRVANNHSGGYIDHLFWDYWQSHGGLQLVGYPLSTPVWLQSPTNGRSYQMQFFERALLEYHPENSPPYNVLPELLGVAAYERMCPFSLCSPIQVPTQVAAVLQTTPAHESGPCVALSDGRGFCQRVAGNRSGGYIDALFWPYWQSHGGIQLIGYPLSALVRLRSSTDGKEYQAQFFERALLEYHPENSPPYDVLAALLGAAARVTMCPGC